MRQSNSPLDDLITRVLEALGDLLPSEGLERIAERLRPALQRVLAPFEIVRREDFEGYLRHLDRLEREIGELEARLEALQNEPPPPPPS